MTAPKEEIEWERLRLSEGRSEWQVKEGKKVGQGIPLNKIAFPIMNTPNSILYKMYR